MADNQTVNIFPEGSDITAPPIMALPPMPDILLNGPTRSASSSTLDSAATTNMHNVLVDSMPILEIIPATPRVSGGLEAFSLRPNLGTSSSGSPSRANGDSVSFADEALAYYGINIGDVDSLKFACLNQGLNVVENFSNEYEESFLEGLRNNSSDRIRQLRFGTGIASGADASAKISELLGGSGVKDTALGKGLQERFDKLQGAYSEQSQTFKDAAGTAAGLLAGNKIDFPQVWKSSAWSVQHSVSIRLYNPDPSSADETMRSIGIPLTLLLMFVIPRSNDGSTFFWPWPCLYRMKGLYNINAGYVKDISVIKGGDDNNIAMNHRAGIVDVKMTFGTLYNTMIGGRKKNLLGTPHLSDYIKEFGNAKAWADPHPSGRGNPIWTRFEELDENRIKTEVENLGDKNKRKINDTSRETNNKVAGESTANISNTNGSRVSDNNNDAGSELKAASGT